MSDEEKLVRDGDDVGISSGDRGGIVFEDRSGIESGGANDPEVCSTILSIGVATEEALRDSARMIVEIKRALSATGSDVSPLQIPCCGTVDGLRFFIEALHSDPWIRANAIIVCFFNDKGNGTFGIARAQDRAYWESGKGNRVLNSKRIEIYDVDSYVELVMASWELMTDGSSHHLSH